MAGPDTVTLFVIEADEYDRMFLGLRPRIAIITTLEHDHPDIYPTPESYQEAFAQFVALLPEDGLLVADVEDKGVQELLARVNGQWSIANGQLLSYSLSAETHPCTANHLYASDWQVNDHGGLDFRVSSYQSFESLVTSLQSLSLSVSPSPSPSPACTTSATPWRPCKWGKPWGWAGMKWPGPWRRFVVRGGGLR
jgi:hypothetical protein